MSYIGNQPQYTSFLSDTFSGNGVTTQFTMTVAPANTAAVLVAIWGVLQDPTTYGVVGRILTFSQAPPTGTDNISVRYLALPASNITTTSYRSVSEFTATAGQTTFTPASYTPGFINVFRSGVRLGASNFTATNGVTVVLTNAAAAGDLITIESFFVSSVLNAIPNVTNAIGPGVLSANAVTSASIAAGAVGQVALDVGNTVSPGTGAMLLPAGTTAQRPGTPIAGHLRFNSTTGFPEIFNQGSWNSFATVANGLTSLTPYTRLSDMINNPNVSGTYWIKSPGMSSAQQYYVDFSQSFGPWIRIFLANTDNYNQTSYTWDNAVSNTLIPDCQYFMYAFVDTSNNALTYPWAWKFNNQSGTSFGTATDSNYAAFRDSPPLGHGGSGAPLITLVNTIRLADNSTYTGFLRTGFSSFGSNCDDGRSGVWGQICLKAGGSGGSGTGTGGFSDFPHYTTFAFSGTDNWAQSNQGYTTGTVNSTRRFGVYVKLS
jgi:hypothetical protein